MRKLILLAAVAVGAVVLVVVLRAGRTARRPLDAERSPEISPSRLDVSREAERSDDAQLFLKAIFTIYQQNACIQKARSGG